MRYRRDPFTDFFEIQKQMDRMMDAFFQDVPISIGQRPVAPEQQLWSPLMDVYETTDTFVVNVELPGIEPSEDVRLSLQGNVLTIRGHRRDRTSTKKEHYHLAEVNYGPFERVIALPDVVDETATPAAHYENGFLEIIVPKVVRPKAREIPVEASGRRTQITICGERSESIESPEEPLEEPPEDAIEERPHPNAASEEPVAEAEETA